MVGFLRWPYTKATENRLGFNDPKIVQMRKKFFKAAGLNFFLLQIVFLSLFCWILGVLWQLTTHVHNLNIVFVDFDGGAIGNAIRAAYKSLAGDGFPELVEQSPLDLASSADVYDSVCHADYWAALYVSSGASARLHTALTTSGGPRGYNGAGALSYVWNEAKYPAFMDSLVSGSIQTLSNAAREIYAQGASSNVTLSELSAAGPGALALLAKPWTLTSINIQPTTQGARFIYNTILILLIMIENFFYLGTINGLCVNTGLSAKAKPHFLLLLRGLNGLVYTFVGSLCTAGAIWAFKCGWDVSGGQFVETWMLLWLFAHIMFLTIDTLTIWLPHPYVPMALITWLILNISSILVPFELAPAFFQVPYISPCHSMYVVLAVIWSRGCGHKDLRYALPVMFAWWLLGLGLSTIGVYRRAHYGSIVAECKAREFQEKLDAAVAAETKRIEEVRGEYAGEGGSSATEAQGTPATNVDLLEKKDAGAAARRASKATIARGDERDQVERDEEEAREDQTQALRNQLSRAITARSPTEQRALDMAPHGTGFGVPFSGGYREADTD